MTDRAKGMMAVAGSSMAIFWCGSFIFGFPGVMAPYWQETFQVGRGPIGSTLFFVLAAVGIFMFFVGHWQERLGTRAMITAGALLCGVDVFGLLLVDSLSGLYVWAFIMGLASCFIYVPGLTTVQRWFPTRRGLASGVLNLAFGISGAVMSPVFTYLFEAFGYVTMIGIVAPVALVAGVAAARLAIAPEAGFPPAPASPAMDQVRSVASLGHSLTVRQAVRTLSFWSLWFTWVMQGAAGIAMVPLSTMFGIARGYELASAVMILTAFNLTSGVSRLVMGYLSDSLGRTRAMSLPFVAAGAAYFILPHVSGLFVIALLAAVIGFAFGTMFSVSAPLVTDCFGLRHFGAIFGLVFTAYGFVAAPLGPSLSGYLLDITNGNFTLVFGYLGCFCLASAMIIRRAVPVQDREPHGH